MTSNTEYRAPRQKVSFFACTALVVSSMVGVGVYTSLGYQVASIPSPAVIIILWMVGGIVALCGAHSYSILCSAFPRSGGEYNFLSKLYHPAVGFMGGVVSALVGFAAPIAISAMAFESYLSAIVKIYYPDAHTGVVPYILIVVVTIMQLRSIFLCSAVQNALTAVNLCLMLTLICVGFFFAPWQSISFSVSSSDYSLIFSKAFGVSLMYVMYAYSGWNAAAYILDEVTDVKKSAAFGIFGGTIITAIMYAALNSVFLLTSPMSEMSNKTEVGLIAGTFILGPKGGLFVSGMICLALAASVSSLLWTGARVISTMGEDIWLFRHLSTKNSGGVPWLAILFLSVISFVYLATSTFNTAVVFVGFILSLCASLCVVGALKIHWNTSLKPLKRIIGAVPHLVFLAVTVSAMILVQAKNSIEAGGKWAMLIGFGLPICSVIVYFPLKNLDREGANK